MVSTLARKLGIALLAIATIAAPVVGAQSRCCKTGAVKGGGQCCCGPQAVEETSSCCQEEVPSCCASEQHPTATEDAARGEQLPAFADAPCHCKPSSQPAAISSAKPGSEISLEQFVALDALPNLADTSQQSLIARDHEPEIARGGLTLHKVHCRWTI